MDPQTSSSSGVPGSRHLGVAVSHVRMRNMSIDNGLPQHSYNCSFTLTHKMTFFL